MSLDFKKELFSKLGKLHRALYGFIAAIICFSRFSGATESTLFLVYNLAFLLCIILFDELLIFNLKKINNQFIFMLRSFMIIILIACAGIIGQMPFLTFGVYAVWGLIVIIEDSIFGDFFDDFGSMPRRISLTIVLTLGAVVFMWDELPGVWAIGFFFFISVYVLCSILEYTVIRSVVKVYDDKYTEQMFMNEDIQAENDQLKTYRDRVEMVNNEINFQRINLTKANSDLEKLNLEIRSLINVMKFFSNSFEVERNSYVMVNNIMDIKRPMLVSMYLDKGIYMNKEPHIDVLVSNEKYREIAYHETVRIFEYVKLRKIMEPITICEDNNFKYPYFSKSDLTDVVAIPAVDNNTIYGVLVVASENYEFLNRGLAFYESSITDFTAALISTKLYLKTEDMAKKDGLTQIYNRYYFNEFYNKMIESIRKEENGVLSVAMIDIDLFKSINDTYGHLAGDEVIKTVARLDAEYAQKYNGRAVRYGGEEFLLILNKPLEETYSILRDLHKDINSCVINFNGTYIRINVSIGVASYPSTNSDIHEVLDSADKALYFSKENGRGKIVIYGREEEALHEDFSY